MCDGYDPIVGGLGSEPVYGIGAVARMLDVSAASLRAREERYGVVIPARNTGDHRLYSRDQVDQLRYVQNLIDSGLHAAEAYRLLGIHLSEGVAPVPSLGAGDHERVLILLAERDPYAAELIEYLLRTEGYEVVVALDAHDAISVFVELVRSAEMSGVVLCNRLSGMGATVVAVSALAIGREAIDAGAAAFLLKPLDPLQVLSAVKDLIGESAVARRTVPTASR
jgi:DNA-binding transcriptional MerR regulator